VRNNVFSQFSNTGSGLIAGRAGGVAKADYNAWLDPLATGTTRYGASVVAGNAGSHDVSADPLEVRNLASSATHRQVLEQMRSEVVRFRKDTKDGWLINDNYK
jgi:hypothetical protein